MYRKRAPGFAKQLTVVLALVLGTMELGTAGLGQAASREYGVDGKATVLRAVVLRRGALSVLAHDHILVAKGITGRLAYNPDAPGASSGEMSVPVSQIEIDDPAERVKEKFTGELNETNRAQVRENMLAADQLAATTFPRITIVLEKAEGSASALRLRVRVRIRQQEQVLTVPASVSLSGDTLTVRGEADLLQSAFGIAPYNALFGAIAVEDAVHVRFEIVAHPNR